MKKILPISIAIVLFAIISWSAQPTPPGDPGPTGGPDNAPITGIEYLLGIGGLYGIKRLMKRKSSDKDLR